MKEEDVALRNAEEISKIYDILIEFKKELVGYREALQDLNLVVLALTKKLSGV